MAKDRGSSPLFNLVAVISAVAALYFAKAILLPVALAILLSFLLSPLVDRLERWRVPRAMAAILVVMMSFGVLGGLGWIVTDQLIELTHELPRHEQDLLAKIPSLRPNSRTLANISKTLSDLRNELLHGGKVKQTPSENHAPPHEESVPQNPAPNERPSEPEAIPVRVVEMPSSPLEIVQSLLGPLVDPLTTAGLVVVLVLFMLLDREGQRSRLIQLFGRSHLHATTEAIHDVAKRIGRYLRALFVVNACYGVVIAGGLWLIGVPNALTWGVLSFALRFLPYLGPWIAASMPILISIATTVGWLQPLLIFGWYIVVEVITYNAIEPFVYGSSVGISTVGVLVTAIFWTWLWGPIGLILAMPMTVCLIVAARYVPQLRFIAILLAEEPALSPAERVYQRLLAFDYHEPLKLAQKHVKESSLVGYYDEILIPALRLAEHDRHSDVLSDEQATFVMEAADDLVQDLGDEALATITANANGITEAPVADGQSGPGDRMPTTRVLCIPLRDHADEVTSHMLAQLLVADGFDVATEGIKSLTNEVVERVAESKSDIVVVSIVPPIRSRDSRLLRKRLRSRYPDLPIVVGFWAGTSQSDNSPVAENDVRTKTATNLKDAITLVRSIAAERHPSAKTA